MNDGISYPNPFLLNTEHSFEGIFERRYQPAPQSTLATDLLNAQLRQLNAKVKYLERQVEDLIKLVGVHQQALETMAEVITEGDNGRTYEDNSRGI